MLLQFLIDSITDYDQTKPRPTWDCSDKKLADHEPEWVAREQGCRLMATGAAGVWASGDRKIACPDCSLRIQPVVNGEPYPGPIDTGARCDG